MADGLYPEAFAGLPAGLAPVEGDVGRECALLPLNFVHPRREVGGILPAMLRLQRD